MPRAIRPDLRHPKKGARRQKPAAKPGIPTIPKTGYAPFDAEAHFADYDHEAVMALSRETLICPASYNRMGTVEHCVGATNRHKLGAKLYIHDDASDEYDAEWLQQFGDRVYRHKASVRGKKGVKNLRSNIVKSIMGDFKPEVFGPWLEEDFGPDGPKYLYMVDSDGYHDPHFFYRIHEIMNLYEQWGTICLYNAKFHSPKHGRAEGSPIDFQTVRRGMSAGISMFFRMRSFREKPDKVQVPDGRGWDGFYSREIGARQVITSLVSYVEHFGKWGFHNKGSFDRDKALNPTLYLTGIRNAALTDIEKKHGDTQKRMAREEK